MRAWCARWRKRRCRWSAASGMRPISPWPTLWPTCARPRPPRPPSLRSPSPASSVWVGLEVRAGAVLQVACGIAPSIERPSGWTVLAAAPGPPLGPHARQPAAPAWACSTGCRRVCTSGARRCSSLAGALASMAHRPPAYCETALDRSTSVPDRRVSGPGCLLDPRNWCCSGVMPGSPMPKGGGHRRGQVHPARDPLRATLADGTLDLTVRRLPILHGLRAQTNARTAANRRPCLQCIAGPRWGAAAP